MILVGDIGGTNSRFALARREAVGWQLSGLSVLPTSGDVPAMVGRYLEEAAADCIEAFGCCGAGPLRADGSLRLTNTGCTLEPRALGRAARTAHVTLVNDFFAVACAVPQLRSAELRHCGGTGAAEGVKLVLGAGTGLGVATLVPASPWTVLPGEGGHADLAPIDEETLDLWPRLRTAHGRVSAETVLSGPGLQRLYAALFAGAALSAAQIAKAAWGGDERCLRAVRIFTRLLGSFAGNLALTLNARGGVYLAGGIVPAWGEHFDARLFRAGFEDKPPFVEWLKEIPAFVVTHPQPGLLGLAQLAEASLKDQRPA